MCYLYTLLFNMIESDNSDSEDDSPSSLKNSALLNSMGTKNYSKSKSSNKKRKFKNSQESSKMLSSPKDSIIIFMNTCKRCEETKEILLNLNIDCVSLHSMMTQNMRSHSLGRFKDLNCKILIATDVASRGLDVLQ